MTLTVTLSAVRRWIAAVGGDPRGFNEVDPVPPLVIVQCSDAAPALSDLNDDGIAVDVEGDDWGARRVAAGDDLEVFHRISVGDVITAGTRVIGTEEKHGRSGPFLLVTRETDYRDARGRLLARRTNSIAIKHVRAQ